MAQRARPGEVGNHAIIQAGKQSYINIERFKPGFHWVKDHQLRPISIQCVYTIYRARMGRKPGAVVQIL